MYQNTQSPSSDWTQIPGFLSLYPNTGFSLFGPKHPGFLLWTPTPSFPCPYPASYNYLDTKRVRFSLSGSRYLVSSVRIQNTWFPLPKILSFFCPDPAIRRVSSLWTQTSRFQPGPKYPPDFLCLDPNTRLINFWTPTAGFLCVDLNTRFSLSFSLRPTKNSNPVKSSFVDPN